MKLIVSVVTVYNVLTLGYCQGNLLSQTVLTKETSTSRTFVCMCSDAASCTADKWEDLLAECRQMLENIDHEATSDNAQIPLTSLEAQEATTSAQGTTTLTQIPTITASCVSDCTGLGNGNYQSCERCDGFVVCFNGRTYNEQCPAGTLWDDNRKLCLHRPSPTCVLNA